MPRVCTVCAHPKRAEIDRALARDGSMRRIAAQFGLVETSVRRHRADHLPARIVKAEAAAEVAQADDLLRQVRQLQGKSITLLQQAERTGDIRTALAGVKEARSCIELVAKLTDQLDERPTINVLMAPEWLTVRGVLLEALQPYPEARSSVSARLMALEASR